MKLTRRELHEQATRINVKLARMLEGEPSLPSLYACLALAVHCAGQTSGMTRQTVHALLDGMLDVADAN